MTERKNGSTLPTTCFQLSAESGDASTARGAARPPVWTPNIAPKCRFDNRVSQTLRLIEPFVGFVESGHRNVEDSEFADGAVAATGLYVNGRHRLNRKDFPIEFNMAVAFQHYVT